MKETNNVSVFIVDKKESEKLIQSMFFSDVAENEKAIIQIQHQIVHHLVILYQQIVKILQK